MSIETAGMICDICSWIICISLLVAIPSFFAIFIVHVVKREKRKIPLIIMIVAACVFLVALIVGMYTFNYVRYDSYRSTSIIYKFEES